MSKKSYPEEMFEYHLQLYRVQARTKFPHDIEEETCKRVNKSLTDTMLTGILVKDFQTYRYKNNEYENYGLPFDLFDTWFHYDSISGNALLRGRSGSIIIDNSICIVDFVLFLITKLQEKSCGECSMCRIGTIRIKELLERIYTGTGKGDDIDTLEHLSEQILNASRCEIGKLAAKAVISSLTFAKSSYKEHLITGTCSKNLHNCQSEGNLNS